MIDTVLQGYGLAGAVIAALVAVVLYQNRQTNTLQRKYDDIQEVRITEARDTMNKITEPLNKIATQQEILTKQYDVLVNRTTKRG